ncbi:S8 family serine peptidase [bacterium]|nr:S8 family serine peptidase [candidate division CSSED10-310 bacterium]
MKPCKIHIGCLIIMMFGLFIPQTATADVIAKFDVALNSIIAATDTGLLLPPDIRKLTDGRNFPLLFKLAEDIRIGDIIDDLDRHEVVIFPACLKTPDPAGFYPAMSTVEGLRFIADLAEIECAYSGIPLQSAAPLNMSAPEVLASQVWHMYAPNFQYLRGSGVSIAIADTGVDIYHPSLFHSDPNLTFTWYDNGNGYVDNSGADWVDINRDMMPQPDEILRFFDARTTDYTGAVSNIDQIYQADVDWLYNDFDNSYFRNYGLPIYSELTPGLGEMLFIADDQNGNNSLDPWENVIGLNMSKVAATFNSDGSTRYRNIDLMFSDTDTYGHGAEVCGILAGGWPGFSRYTGIAPECDLMMYNRWNAIGMTLFSWWATIQVNSHIMLWELGAWTGLYLDGTDLWDQQINASEDLGIIQVVPAGNLAGGYRHASGWVDPDPGSGQPSEYVFTNLPSGVTFYQVLVTLLWANFAGTAPTFDIYDPSNGAFSFNMPSGVWTPIGTTPNHQFFAQRSTSMNNTCMFHIELQNYYGGTQLTAPYFQINIHSAQGNPNYFIHIFGSDDASGWSGGTQLSGWNNITVNDVSTITCPATAADAITVTSYSTRTDGYGSGTIIGQISPFSGRGPRIDNVSISDVSAPGDWDVYSTASIAESTTIYLGEFTEFGGTSASGPHVAGAAALYRQFNPSAYATPVNVRNRIRSDAIADSFTGFCPNDTWGYGKLRIAITPIYSPPPTLTPIPTSTPPPTSTPSHTSIPTQEPTSTIPPQPTHTAVPTTTPTVPTGAPTHTALPPTSTPSHTPTAITPTVSHTPSPTVTLAYPSQTPTPLFSETPQPTGSPQPTDTPSPWPTPPGIGLDLKLNAAMFHGGDLFSLKVDYWNHTPDPLQGTLAVVLAIEQHFWFWPSWGTDLDWEDFALDPGGEVMERIILEFNWPQGNMGSYSGIQIIAALLDPALTRLLCDYDLVAFGYE